ncbi:MAG: DUF2066 domain-containing protein [Gammaproteobacteria bacterium]
MFRTPLRPPALAALLLLVLAVAWVPVAHAATVGGLYSAVVSVADRSAAESERGVARALAVVLKKVTGRSDILDAAAGRALLGNAQRYVTVIGHEAGGNDVDGWRLRVDFDARAVAGALRERGVVLWGQQRPQTYAWILLDDADGRRFVPDEKYPELREAVDAQAVERAIPLARGGVDPALAAGLASLPAEELLTALVGDAAPPAETPASPTPVVASPVQPPKLGGVLSSTDGLAWQGRWRIVIDGEVTEFETTGDSPHAAATAGIERAADALGAHFANPAVFGGVVAAFALTVQGVQSAGDYGRAFSLLRGLDTVTALGVQRVTGHEVLFQVSARGGLPAVAESLRLTSTLLPVADAPATYVLAH